MFSVDLPVVIHQYRSSAGSQLFDPQFMKQNLSILNSGMGDLMQKAANQLQKDVRNMVKNAIESIVKGFKQKISTDANKESKQNLISDIKKFEKTCKEMFLAEDKKLKYEKRRTKFSDKEAKEEVRAIAQVFSLIQEGSNMNN